MKSAYFSRDQYHFYARHIQHLPVEHHCNNKSINSVIVDDISSLGNIGILNFERIICLITCSVEVLGGLERLVVLATVILVSVHILHSNLRNFHHYD